MSSLEPALFDFCPWDFYIWKRFRQHPPMIKASEPEAPYVKIISPTIKSSESDIPYVKLIPPHSFIQDFRTKITNKDGFKTEISVKHFKPNEVTVRVVGNTIRVEGEHDELEDEFGTISRRFVRTYDLPKACDARDVVSNLSSDGILTIQGPPRKKSTEKTKERIIHIQHTGEPAGDIEKLLYEDDTCRIA